MVGGSERERGEFAVRIAEVEKDMRELQMATVSDAPTSLKTRLGAVEEERKLRTAKVAGMLTAFGCVMSLVVWIAASGVVQSVDALREDFRAMKRASAARPAGVVP